LAESLCIFLFEKRGSARFQLLEKKISIFFIRETICSLAVVSLEATIIWINNGSRTSLMPVKFRSTGSVASGLIARKTAPAYKSTSSRELAIFHI
jgi:hypothetical protein